jgi:non-ribosomal peptide synthetase component F
VEMVQPPRHLNHTPIFQVMFSWQNQESSLPELPGVSVEPLRMPYEAMKFDLQLDLAEEGERIGGTLRYATALFDEATIKRQAGYLMAILEAMVADSQQEVARIEIVGTEERKLLLEEWNATEAEYAEDTCIHELFEEQVEKTPGATAVAYEEQSLTYAELNQHANQLAHYLIGFEVKPEEPVAICVERGIGMVVGLLGILKAGGAYVPLDPAYPSQRLREILKDAGPRIVLSDAAGREVLGEEVLAEKLALDLDSLQQPELSLWAEMPVTNPDGERLGLSSEHTAYVIYTSGSTGTPKGVMVEHRSVTNFYGAMKRSIYGDCSSPLRVGWNASFAFDMSIK